MENYKPALEFDPEAQKNLEVPLGEREMQPCAGKYMAEILKEQDVSLVFGVHGGHIWQITDSISRIGIKSIQFHHEANAVYAGEAYSQVSRKPAVCYGTVGPGVANSVPAIQQAYLSNTPIIYLAGGHEPQHDKLYNTIQESYATELMGPISKFTIRCHYPATVKQFLTRVFKAATSYPRGPAVLESTLTLLCSPQEVDRHAHMGVFGDDIQYKVNWNKENTSKPISGGGGDPDDIAKAVEQILNVKNPFMIIGDGCNWADAGEELDEFSRLAKVPFTQRRYARAVVSEEHPNHYRGLPPFRREIDLMIPIGMKVGFFDGFGAGWPETIQINESAEHIWTYLDTSTAIVGNPKVVLRQMIDYIKENNLSPSLERDKWLKKIKDGNEEAKRRRREKADKYREHKEYVENDFMHYGVISQDVADYLEKNYDNRVRVMVDGFTISPFAMPFLTATRPAQILTSSENAGVGHGVPMAIGAAFAQLEEGDETPVLSLMGDSGFGLAGTEVETAVRYNLPIVYLVTNNDGWMPGMKSTWYGDKWENLGPQDRPGVKWKGRTQYGYEFTPNIGWDKMAEALGCYGETVDRHENFMSALDRCFKAAEKGQPAVLNCIMDKRLVNQTIVEQFGYGSMYVHLPWDELPKRGKASRQQNMSFYFTKLKEYPEMDIADAWDPPTEEEMKP